MRSLICILLLAMMGCASLKDLTRSTLTADERAMVVSRARTLVLESALVQESERKIVESSEPTLTYYFLSGVHYAQYFIVWKFSEHERVSVSGQGNLLTLDGAKVERLPQKPLQTTAACPDGLPTIKLERFHCSPAWPVLQC